MVKIVKSAIVTYSPEEMNHLVNDVERYPEFLQWCEKGSIDLIKNSHYEATLDMSVKGFKVSFKTSNYNEYKDGVVLLNLKLLEGPFKSLFGHWSFTPLGKEGCRVGLHLNYEVKSILVNQLFSKSFEKIAERMVSDFVCRAAELYD